MGKTECFQKRSLATMDKKVSRSPSLPFHARSPRRFSNMMISRAQPAYWISPRLIVVLIICPCFLYFLPRHTSTSIPASTPLTHFPTLKPQKTINHTVTSSTFSAPVLDFWDALAGALEDARPPNGPINVDDGIPSDFYTSFEPTSPGKERVERLELSAEDELAMFRAHYAMRISAQRLAHKVVYKPGSTGIVTTANPKYLSIFLVSLRMLRRTGCQLPFEVFIGDWTEYNATLCDHVLPALNARCIVLSEIYSKAEGLKPPDHFQYKVFAMLFSSFQNILFLDSDSFPAFDPAPLFTKPPFSTHGLVTWPDFWANTASSHYYHIAGIPEVPVSTRLSTESGQLMLDKSKHSKSLLMMVYYNYYGPDYYYPLLCQGSHGAGDKETFIPAAMAVEAPFYQVKKGVHALGRDRDGHFMLAGMAQGDPAQDFVYGRPMPSHIHNKDEWQKDDFTFNETEAADAANGSPSLIKKPRAFFIHQNMHKTEPKEFLSTGNDPLWNSEGHYQRMWGTLEDIRAAFGYDVERRLWEVIAEEACREDAESDTCGGIKHLIEEIFGPLEYQDGHGLGHL